MAGKKGRSGRPKGSGKPVEIYKLQALALIGVPVNKMAVLLGISADTLDRRFRSVIEDARTEGERQILHTAFKLAMEGNIRMLELCLINRCGWANRPEVMVNVTQNTLTVPNITAETKEKLAQLHQLIRREALLGTPNEAGGNGDAADGMPPTVS